MDIKPWWACFCDRCTYRVNGGMKERGVHSTLGPGNDQEVFLEEETHEQSLEHFGESKGCRGVAALARLGTANGIVRPSGESMGPVC